MNFFDSRIHQIPSADAIVTPPFLKWAGGKRWLFKRYRHLFPEKVTTLIDPFLGGGSSFFYLAPERAILSDLNSDLIELYRCVRDHPRTLTRSLAYFHHAHSKSFFYRVRKNKPHAPLKKAAWLLYLNRTCWNGLFRVNLRGEFNVPIGTKSKVFDAISEFDQASAALRKASLLASDFEEVVNLAGKGDLVFADPPYFEKRVTVRFLKYNSNIFSWSDQLRLRDALVRASSRGARCFVTNANHRSLTDLYRDAGLIHRLRRHSVVSGNNKGRGIDREILVEIK